MNKAQRITIAISLFLMAIVMIFSPERGYRYQWQDITPRLLIIAFLGAAFVVLFGLKKKQKIVSDNKITKDKLKGAKKLWWQLLLWILIAVVIIFITLLLVSLK